MEDMGKNLFGAVPAEGRIVLSLPVVPGVAESEEGRKASL